MSTVALPSMAMSARFVEARGGLPPSTTGFVIESVSDLILFGLVPLFLTVATVWILWHVLEKIDQDVRDVRSFLTFILVVIPFVALILRAGYHTLRCDS
jgi:hypothetical protein